MTENKVTRIINAKQVFITNNNLRLETLGFDMGEAYIRGGYTSAIINFEEPRCFSAMDTGCLEGRNYFLGEVEVIWHPKMTNKKRRNVWADDKTAIRENLVETFTLVLPKKCVSETTFEKALAMKDKIRHWRELWYKECYISYGWWCNFPGSSREEGDNMRKEMNEIWKELEEKNLVRNGLLLNPQFLFIIPERKVKRACYNQAQKFNIRWITPNVCVADNEEDFFKLMKKCYGKMNIID